LNFDTTYQKMVSDKMMIFQYIDKVEIPSFILTLPDEDLLQLKEYVKKDDMYKHLAGNMLDVLLDEEESEEVYRKVELLG